MIGSLRIRVPVLAGVLLAAGLALTGCGPAKAGAAVIIDQQRVPISMIQNKVESVTTGRAQHGLEPKPADDLAREQIQRLITHELYLRVAAQRGVTVTDGQIDKTIADLETRFGGAAGFQEQVAAQNIAPGDLRTFVQDFLIADALTKSISAGATSEAETATAQQELETLIKQTAQTLPVRVNPRYGVWNPENGAVTAAPDSVSVPESAPPVTPGQ